MTSDPLKYRDRTYRNKIRKGTLISFQVQLRETDLWISAPRDLHEEAARSVYRHRHFIEEYIKFHPEFLTSFLPLTLDPFAPPIVREMLEAAVATGVGPMASVAGAVAQYVGTDLLRDLTNDVIVENGGDIYIATSEEVLVGIFAGDSPLSEKVALRIKPTDTPLGICTSSGTIGHSVSLGTADAVCVVSKKATLADAAATAVGNLVKAESDIKKALVKGMELKGVQGILIIVGESLGIKGAIELV